MTTAYRGTLYLSRQNVEQLCKEIDATVLMREAFKIHNFRQTVLPEKTCLSWTNDLGEKVHNYNIPCYVGGDVRTSGTKIVNSNICNTGRGISRSGNLILLYDDTSARVACILEGTFLSSLCTAAVTALAADLLQGPAIQCVAIIGAGIRARAHISLLIKHLPQLRRILMFDINHEHIAALRKDMNETLCRHNILLQETSTAEEAIRPAQLIVPVTTTTIGYIRFSWLSPGSILVNVSLDDPLPEVILKATTVVVDDWTLVRNDQQRLMGKMYRAGQLLGPQERYEMLSAARRRIDMQLGDLVTGAKVGRRSLDDIILVTPSGLPIEDIVLAAHVYQKALALNTGVWLES